MGIGLLRVKDLPAVQLICQNRHVVLLGQAADGGHLLRGVDHAGGVVGVGVEEQLDPALEGLLQLLQVDAGVAFHLLPAHLDGDDLPFKELHQLPIVKIVRFHDGHLVSAGHQRAHSQEQRALSTRGQNDLCIGVHRSTAVFCQLFRQILADGPLAPVLRVGLIGALHSVLLHKGLQTAWDRCVGVDISVGEVNRRSLQLVPDHGKGLLLLKALLAGGVVSAQS